MEKELPTKTAEEIREHEQWFAEFTTLLNSKKAAIEAWKEDKQVHTIYTTAFLCHYLIHFRFQSHRQKHLEGVVEEASNTKQSVKQEIFQKEREARFSKLEAWKVSEFSGKLYQQQA